MVANFATFLFGRDMINIRKILKEDKENYINLVKKFYNSPAVLHNVSEENFYNTFNEIITSDIYTEGFILEFNENLAGYFLISKTYSQEVGSKVLLIEEIYILEEFRSKGIGKKIFEFLENRYKDFKRFRLEVGINNTEAINLYEKLGYTNLNYLQYIKDR